MLEIGYKSSFICSYNEAETSLQEEIREKINLFKDKSNHQSLKVHKLRGPLKDRYSFSVNYKTRIVFRFTSKNEAVLLDVGDHDLYK
ncbi:MAG: type II toxin-antitoxin system mRNA interferase toxin, RelE/StbE family [Candidatus Taylorbacteria bacterium]|nr:type II toxin-antitoxin system mRNA interferase toxin, RelE/StbE family [Candidatus Taylorbacteria bacterium]